MARHGYARGRVNAPRDAKGHFVKATKTHAKTKTTKTKKHSCPPCLCPGDRELAEAAFDRNYPVERLETAAQRRAREGDAEARRYGWAKGRATSKTRAHKRGKVTSSRSARKITVKIEVRPNYWVTGNTYRSEAHAHRALDGVVKWKVIRKSKTAGRCC